MKAHTMTTKQVAETNNALFKALAVELNQIEDARLMLGESRCDLDGDDVRNALEAALLLGFAPAGGVLLIWWDADDGLRTTPTKYPAENWQDDGEGWGK